MKLFIFLSYLITVATSLEDYTISFWPQSSEQSKTRIINGENADIQDAPFICSLRLNQLVLPSHTCGASILSKNWVVTAAHCMTETPQNLNMSLQCGVTNRVDILHQQVRAFNRVSDVKLHPQWKPHTVGPNDIALINVKEQFDLNSFVKVIALPASNFNSGSSDLFGWGLNNNPLGTLPLELRTAEMDLITFDVCRDRLGNINPTFPAPLDATTNICAARGFTSACSGDSGGPLVYNVTGQLNDRVLIGIVSWGISPCGKTDGVPSVFTRVFSHIAWILSETGPL